MRKIMDFLKRIFHHDKVTPEEEREILEKIIKKIKES